MAQTPRADRDAGKQCGGKEEGGKPWASFWNDETKSHTYIAMVCHSTFCRFGGLLGLPSLPHCCLSWRSYCSFESDQHRSLFSNALS